MNDTQSFTGELNIILRDQDGNIKKDVTVPNLVVTAGKNFIVSRIAGASASVMSHMAIGSGSTAPAAGDATLGTELAREALSISGGTPSGVSITFAGSFPAGTGTGTIAEAGILNNSSGGTLLARTTFTAIPKAAGDSITITWTITAN